MSWRSRIRRGPVSPSSSRHQRIRHPDTGGSSLGAILTGGAGTTACLLPVFLTGALGAQLTDEFRFGAAGLGGAVGIYRLVSAVVAVHMGRVADRLGAIRSLRLAGATAAVACLGIATLSTSWATLVIFLAIAGCAISLSEPAANRLLVSSVPSGRLGTAFGFKQSAPPGASLLAGLSVPLVASTIGWRWAFVIGAVMCVGAIIGARARPTGGPRNSSHHQHERLRDPSTIFLLSMAFSLSTAGSTVVPAFYVTGSVAAGLSEQRAGVLLAGASAVTIIVRMCSGVVADRMAGAHLQVCAGGLIAGCVGLALLATSDAVVTTIGIVVALAGTWGFNNVFWFAVVRAYSQTPGAITGAVAPSGMIGGVVGPLLFGVLANGLGYEVAWVCAAMVALLAAGAMLICVHRLASLGDEPRGRLS